MLGYRIQWIPVATKAHTTSLVYTYGSGGIYIRVRCQLKVYTYGGGNHLRELPLEHEDALRAGRHEEVRDPRDLEVLPVGRAARVDAHRELVHRQLLVRHLVFGVGFEV